MYAYTATLLHVVDGDTVWLDVDLGFDVSRRDSFRLLGINAPEMGTSAGVEARQALAALLPSGRRAIDVRTTKDKREKYGRYLASLFVGGVDVNGWMVENGFAVPYMVKSAVEGG